MDSLNVPPRPGHRSHTHQINHVPNRAHEVAEQVVRKIFQDQERNSRCYHHCNYGQIHGKVGGKLRAGPA